MHRPNKQSAGAWLHRSANQQLLKILPDPKIELFIQDFSAKEFHKFKKLPLELRLEIWRYAMPGRRRIAVYHLLKHNYKHTTYCPTPVLLHVSQETRLLALETLHLLFEQSQNDDMKPIYFDPTIDRVHLKNIAPLRVTTEFLTCSFGQLDWLGNIRHLKLDGMLFGDYAEWAEEYLECGLSDVWDDVAETNTDTAWLRPKIPILQFKGLQTLELVLDKRTKLELYSASELVSLKAEVEACLDWERENDPYYSAPDVLLSTYDRRHIEAFDFI